MSSASRVLGIIALVLVAMAGPGALMTRSQPNEYGLTGMHGSLTAAELTVPLLIG